MSAPPYYAWYPGDYARDTRGLTCEQHGAYRTLLDECWVREGLLPDDDATLARIVGLTSARWSKHKPVVIGFFTWTPEGWRHKRISRSLGEAAEAYERRAQAGRKGGLVKPSNAKAMLEQCRSNQNQNQNQNQKEEPSQEEGNSQRGAGEREPTAKLRVVPS